MDRKPWVVEEEQFLETKFWRFSYTILPMKDSYGVKGAALPRGTIPTWADWLRELWLEAYLCDAKGRVMASDLRTFIPRELTPRGVDFEFILEPDDLGSGGQLFITFGYRMEAVARKDAAKSREDGGRVFFAHEGELSLF